MHIYVHLTAYRHSKLYGFLGLQLHIDRVCMKFKFK